MNIEDLSFMAIDNILFIFNPDNKYLHPLDDENIINLEQNKTRVINLKKDIEYILYIGNNDILCNYFLNLFDKKIIKKNHITDKIYQDLCVICYDTMSNTINLPCGHKIFCSECVNIYLKIEIPIKCLKCKSTIDLIKID